MHPPYGAGPASKKKKKKNYMLFIFKYTKMPANLASVLATR